MTHDLSHFFQGHVSSLFLPNCSHPISLLFSSAPSTSQFAQDRGAMDDFLVYAANIYPPSSMCQALFHMGKTCGGKGVCLHGVIAGHLPLPITAWSSSPALVPLAAKKAALLLVRLHASSSPDASPALPSFSNLISLLNHQETQLCWLLPPSSTGSSLRNLGRILLPRPRVPAPLHSKTSGGVVLPLSTLHPIRIWLHLQGRLKLESP